MYMTSYTSPTGEVSKLTALEMKWPVMTVSMACYVAVTRRARNCINLQPL